MRDLDVVIKAYDVRGTVPDQLDADLARDVGAAFVEVVAVRTTDGGPGAVVVGRDMRPSGPELVEAFAEGVCARGCDVVRIGLCSTDGLYFASGRLGLPGAMFTASHNPARYNGIKMCRPGAAPVSRDTGLADIKKIISQGGLPEFDGLHGIVRDRDLLGEYAAFLRSLVDLRGIRPLRVVIDAGNGMAGHTAPAVLGTSTGLPPLPVTVVPMYFELDGTFPNHPANPIDPANLVDLRERVSHSGADLGLAFDGDADRCFVVDERGEAISPSALTGLIADRMIADEPGARIIYNLITSQAVPELVEARGGKPIRTRVGHSFIKGTMAETGAVFGGEHSGHYYFRDFWRADSGMLAALHILFALGHTAPGTTVSSLVAKYQVYSDSGEINSVVEDPKAAVAAVRTAFPDHGTDELDGLTVFGDRYWFNLRPSNTEPLLRLNVEANDEETMLGVRDQVLAIVRGDRDG